MKREHRKHMDAEKETLIERSSIAKVVVYSTQDL